MAGGLGGGDKLVLINPLANPPTSLPVKIMRLDGKLMGQLVPDTTVVTSSTYIGCRGRRPCLENCSYSLANRKLIHNSVTLTVSGIADSVCTATRSQFGGSLSTTITHSGFAAMNGAYFLSMVDACWPVNDTTFPGSPLESYVTKWTFNPTIRYQSTQTGGSNPFSFDVTCTLQVEIIVGRSDTADNAFFGVDLDLIAFPLSPSPGVPAIRFRSGACNTWHSGSVASTRGQAMLRLSRHGARSTPPVIADCLATTQRHWP